MNIITIFWLHVIVEAKRLSDAVSPSMYKTVNQRVNVASEFPGAVDFGHVYRNQIKEAGKQEDLEEDLPEPNAKELFNIYREPQTTLKPDSLIFLSPRDEIQYYNKLKKTDSVKDSSNDTQKRLSRPTWYDFPKLLERNLANPFANRRIAQTIDNRKYNKIDRGSRVNASNMFEENSFYLKSNKNSHALNWTKCNEFARRAAFHPDDVVNTQWLPFYIWSMRDFSSSTIHTFSYPTKKIVQFYKSNYKPYITKNINWYEPKLLLKERREILLIAGDRRGLFYGIPKQELPANVKDINITMPLLTLRMKIHDPYLALMYCDERYAVIMAEAGTGPNNDSDKVQEASTLKFRGIGKPVHRDFEAERLQIELQKKRMMEEEAKKIIHINSPLGDVDYNLPIIKGGVNPRGLHENDSTSCEEFSRFARFNPYSVLLTEWMAFYYWGPPQSPMFVKFFVPTTKQMAYIKYVLEGHVLESINWTAKILLMREQDNRTYVLVEKNDRGHYHLYEPYRNMKESDIVNAVDLRFKQTGDSRYFGIMECERKIVYMFARVNDIPKKDKVQDEAARLGYRGRGGRSYLYQGHQWMPIPEAEDWHFELLMKERDNLRK